MRTLLIVIAATAAACNVGSTLGTNDGSVDGPPQGTDARAADAAPSDGGIADAPPHGDPFAQLLQTPGHCTPDGWCYQFPAPHGNEYVKIISSGPDDIWLTAWGVVMQWDGTVWRYHDPPALSGQPTSEFPMTIAESSSSNVWLVYGTALEHWDGTTWKLLESLPLSGNPNYNVIAVAPDGTAFVTRGDGVLEVWHGESETTFNAPCGCFLGSVFAPSATDVFITADPGIVHFDGSTFTTSFTSPDGEFFSGFSGVTNDVFAAGQTQVAHWDGSAWTELPGSPGTDGLGDTSFLTPVAYNGTNDVTWWNAGGTYGFLHWNGTTLAFTAVDQDQDNGLPLFNSGEVIDGKLWLVGGDGAVYTSTDMQTISGVQKTTWESLTGMWAAADDDIYYTVGAEVRHWDGVKLRAMQLDLGTIYGDIGNIVGQQTDGVDELYISALEELADGNYEGSVFVYDGTTWTKTSFGEGSYYEPAELTQIQPLGPGEALGVGYSGIIYHFMNGSWQPITTAPEITEDLVGLWASDLDHDHAWFVGANRDVYEWQRSTPDGGSDVITVDTPGLNSDGNAEAFGPISGTAGYPWIASPFTATVWIRDANGWTETPAATTGDQAGAFKVLSPTDAYMANDGETFVWHFDGTSWNFEDDGTTLGDRFITATPSGRVFLGNNAGIVSHP
jgi:hypothetical protein